MGLYIEAPHPLLKARWLIEAKGATHVQVDLGDLPPMPDTGTVLVCVVENGFFDAAAVAVTEAEVARFASIQNGRDLRPRTWVSLPLETVKELVGEESCKHYGL
jgi:hypothetical protein